MRRSIYFLTSVLLVVVLPAQAASDSGFQGWITHFRAEAVQQGVSARVYDTAFRPVTTQDAVVLEKAAYQPEFKAEAWEYIDNRVNERTVAAGREKLQQYAPVLQRIERNSGVDRYILLAIWSMESGYGAALQKPDSLHYIPQALATLAYADSKRSRYARTQLVAALKVLQRGDVQQADFLGSWAGAMGHTQFIPTSYLLYAVDGDGDGRSDIWHSVPDALATAANLLKKNGWRSGERWGYEVTPGQQKNSTGNLLALQGNQGPVFALQKNFTVLKRYNNADKYALAVGLLADRIAGKHGLQQDWQRPYTPLSQSEAEELQRLLAAQGFYSGEVDGKIGDASRRAIVQFQASRHAAQTGYPSKEVLTQLRVAARR
ncbi:MAG: lytic murein transglycosylase [Pseudomonadales bacterium]|nr:lytic murein transglycosylase [Pseudomonadales bacterium]